MTANSGQHQRTKHIDIRHHFVKNLVSDSIIALHYMPTNSMVADIFTKALAAPTFIKLRKALLNLPSPSSGSVVA